MLVPQTKARLPDQEPRLENSEKLKAKKLGLAYKVLGTAILNLRRRKQRNKGR